MLEDFGPDDAQSSLEDAAPGVRKALGRQLIAPLVTLADFQPRDLPEWNPPLGRARLRWELAGFELWFLRHHLEVAPPPSVGHWLDELAAAIAEHPQRVCHRDFHLNNLFLLADGSVGLIDYQDILLGPDTYDAVSLLGERGMPRILSETDRIQVQEIWAADTNASRVVGAVAVGRRPEGPQGPRHLCEAHSGRRSGLRTMDGDPGPPDRA